MFKFSSIDPKVNCSEIVASVNDTKVTSGVITSMIALRDLLPMVGLDFGMAMSNAAGCNWVLYCDTLSMHTFQDALPCEMILEKYTEVDFDVRCLMTNPVTIQCMIFLPDMSHLTKNIVTSLELSSSLNSKQDLRYGHTPMNMQMIE